MKPRIRLFVTALAGRVVAGHQNSKGTDITDGSRQDVTSDFMRAVIDKSEYHGGTFVIEGDARKWNVIVEEIMP